MRPTPITFATRLLCLTLATAMAVPSPALLLADDGKDGGLPAPVDPDELTLDLRGLDGLDLDPVTGALVYAREDLRLGEGPQELRVVRTYKPWAGDQLDFGTHWASLLTVHLDVHPSRTRAAFVAEDGHRTFFAADKADAPLKALAGFPATIEVLADGYVVTGLGDERTWRFDAAGYLTSRAGADGKTGALAFRWDDQRRLRAVDGPWGRLAVERDDRGQLRALVTPGGARVTYGRDGLGNLTSVARGGAVERYGWDAAGRLAGLGDDAARVAWDALGRVVAIDGKAVRPTTARYLQTSDPQLGREVHVARGGERWTVTVSPDGRRVERTGERGDVAVTLLDERDRPVELVVTAPGVATQSWTQTFDDRGRLAARGGPEGTVRFEYGSKVTDKPTKITLADGRVTTFTYDLKGNPTEAVAPGGATTRWTWDAQGRVATVTDQRGVVTRHTYDERGFLAQTDEDGVGATRFQRDQDGRIVKVKRPDGRVVDVQRDAEGRATRITDASGVLSAVEYDARGRVARLTDELGQTIVYGWSPLGELTKVEDGQGLLLSLEYDARGRLRSTKDALGNTTTWSRPDALTLVVEDATSGKRVLEHDALGRVAKETRAGAELRFGYDAKGRLAQRTTPKGVETFQYDEAGRLIGLQGPDGGFLMGYDAAGRLARLTDAGLGQSVEYAYTAAGDRASMKTPAGTTKYKHDAQGRVTAIELPEGGTIGFELGPDGRRKEVRYPNGAVTRYAYQRGRVTEIVTQKGETVLDRRAYGYDQQGRVAWSEELKAGRTEYVHDARGRLVEARTPQGVQRWAYDAAGNRLSETRGGAEIRSKIGAGNRLESLGETTFGYDAGGRLIEEKGPQGTTRYAHDVDGHVTQVTLPDGKTVRYGYAPNGARLWREGPEGRTAYLHDLADVVADVDGASGRVVESYVHGPGTDDLLATRKGDATWYYHRDLVNSVTSMTSQDGAVAARYAYDAFGREQLAEGPAAQWNAWRYTGRRLDAATGDYDLRARTYSPDAGRFTTPDPIGPLGGLNLYAYVDNDPTLFNDPYGLKAWYERLWDGTRDAASSVASWARGVAPDVKEALAYAGRQTWAFTRGFGKGLWNAGKGIVNMVLNPLDTIDGIVYAIEHWDETKEAFVALWEEYKDAAVNDPEKFAEMTGMLTAEVVVSIAGTKGLDKLAKARFVAGAASRVATATRTVGAPVTRLAGRTGTTLASRFPRVAETVRRGAVMDRARRIELASRAARPGNVLVRNGRRVVDVGRDIGRAARTAVRQPGAFVVYSGRRLSRSAAALVAATGRGTWTAGKRFGIPTVLAFEDQITDAINRTASREDAMGAVEREGRRLLAEAPTANPSQLAERIDAVGRAYRDYRNRLLAPVHEEDLALKRRLDELNAAVERGEIPDNTVDSRLDAILSEYGRRRHNLMVDLYERGRDVEHDMLHPSPNRTISFQDEIDLLKAALAKVTDAEGRALLEARIADLEALMQHEYELFRSGEHDALIAGIAGPPRDPGVAPTPTTPAPTPTTPTTDPLPSDTLEDELPADTLDGLVDPGDNE